MQQQKTSGENHQFGAISYPVALPPPYPGEELRQFAEPTILLSPTVGLPPLYTLAVNYYQTNTVHLYCSPTSPLPQQPSQQQQQQQQVVLSKAARLSEDFEQ